MNRKINVVCNLSPYESYGLVAYDFINGLLDAGWKVVVVPYRSDVPPGMNIPERIARCGGPLNTDFPRLVLNCTNNSLGERVQPGDVVFTMWETDRVPALWVSYLNRAKAVIVPCEWLVNVYKRSGVKCPVYSVPLGVNTDIFTVDQKNFPKGAIFTTAGRMWSGRYRKGLDRVILAFLYAFPSESDVVLRVKTHSDCPIHLTQNPKIQLVTTFLNETDLARFYQEALCYVSGATGEGWGWHQHEAMACGKALIAPRYSGLTAFFKGEAHGISVPYKIEPVKDFFPEGNCGRWAVASIEDLARAMQYAYTHRLDMFLRGLQAHTDVTKFDKKRSQKELVKVLNHIL